MPKRWASTVPVRRFKSVFCLGLAASLSACQPAMPPANLGGELSTPATRLSVSTALSPAERLEHSVGASLFTKPWVIAPSTTRDRDGLGPLFNAHSCSSCHQHNGRGELPARSTDQIGGLIFRLQDSTNSQLQTRALPGFSAEGRVALTFREHPHSYPDGEQHNLRALVFQAEPPQPLSPRLAPPLVGMGLIDAIAASDIAAGADPLDSDNDGISGRVANTPDGPGRFGWKGESPSLEHQVARAFVEDMGITSHLFPVEPGCPALGCSAISGGEPEISTKHLRQVVAFLSALGIPQARLERQHHQGWKLFNEAGCAACHRPQWQTRSHTNSRLSQQTIYPFSDFLLHDMGSALADPSGSADAAEWRTAPLWALDDGPWLHDGRARTLEEAILWHGGEAQRSQQMFRAFTSGERQALVEFLRAL